MSEATYTSDDYYQGEAKALAAYHAGQPLPPGWKVTQLRPKAGLVRVTPELLGKLLGLRPECRIDCVFQDATDMANDSFTLRIRGGGDAMQEGNTIQYLGLEDFQ